MHGGLFRIDIGYRCAIGNICLYLKTKPHTVSISDPNYKIFCLTLWSIKFNIVQYHLCLCNQSFRIEVKMKKTREYEIYFLWKNKGQSQNLREKMDAALNHTSAYPPFLYYPSMHILESKFLKKLKKGIKI